MMLQTIATLVLYYGRLLMDGITQNVLLKVNISPSKMLTFHQVMENEHISNMHLVNGNTTFLFGLGCVVTLP